MVRGLGRWRRGAARVCAGSLFSCVAYCAPVSPSHAQDAPDLAKTAGELIKAVEAFAKDAPLGQVEKATPDKRKAVLDAVQNAAEDLAKYQRIDSAGALVNEATRLKITFDELRKDRRKLEALRDINRVDAKAKDKNDRLTAIDKEYGAQLHAALANLRAILTTVGPTRRINVIGAWYGDRDTILSAQPKSAWESRQRYCTATAAVQALCEGRSACFTVQADGDGGGSGSQSVTGAGSDITAEKMCGYDPVPYASAETKGLIVLYGCLSVSDEDWKEQLDLVWRGIKWRGRPPYIDKGVPDRGMSDKSAGTTDTGTDAAKVAAEIFAADLRVSQIAEIRCYRGDIGQ